LLWRMIARILDEWILIFVLHFHSYLRTFRAFWRLPDLPGYLYFILFLWNRIGLRDSWMSGYVFLFCVFLVINTRNRLRVSICCAAAITRLRHWAMTSPAFQRAALLRSEVRFGFLSAHACVLVLTLFADPEITCE